MFKTHVLPPNPSRLIEGLRDTGYNFNTALADIVDNSVDAGASKIEVGIKMDVDGEIFISVLDNGCGMDLETLLDGMTYGAIGKENPRRLGKFGLGLKTASTAFCRRLSVITRDSSEAKLLKATWDLDHVVKAGEWELLMEDVEEEERELIDGFAENSSGTLVIWKKVDRVLKEYSNPSGVHARRALDKIIESFNAHASMIYQRFLDRKDDRARNIEISLNGQPLSAWDPFCVSEQETELVAEKKNVEVELSNGDTAKFTVRAYVLPRREHFSSVEAAKNARLTNNMQGIYIYRENRLIHPADWLGMFAKEPHLTLLRVEFSFMHDLDEEFNVDIKKSQIILNEGLYNWIMNEFIPAPRNAANERYRKGQRKITSEKAKDAHGGSNRNISDKEADLKTSEIEVIDPGNDDAEVTNKSGKVRVKIKIDTAEIPGQVCVKPVDTINDGQLWEPAIIDQHHAVRINTGHPFYRKVYVPNLASDVIVQGMDSLLWGLVEAELGTINESTKKHFEELRYEVSRLLRKLVEDLPEPDLNDEEQ